MARGTMVCGMVVWWYGSIEIRWYDDIDQDSGFVIWWYDTMWYDGMVFKWNGGGGVVELWYDGGMIA